MLANKSDKENKEESYLTLVIPDGVDKTEHLRRGMFEAYAFIKGVQEACREMGLPNTAESASYWLERYFCKK